MTESYDFIRAIQSQMAEKDRRFYEDIWEPFEVATPDGDAWNHHLCVMPNGEIRIYGEYGREHVYQENVKRCYIASCDGGLSWKRHLTNDAALGSSIYVPYLNKYVTAYGEERGGEVYLLMGDTPDAVEIERILIDDQHGGQVGCVFPMRSRNRVLVVVHELRPELHPTAKFASLYYGDDDLKTWHRVCLEAAPFYQPVFPATGVRWQQNNRENTIEELSDGSLMMISRTALDYHYICYSNDGGESWSSPQPSVFHSTATMPRLKRLSDGRLLFIWCNTRPLPELDDADGIWEDVFTNRDANHIAISEDDGKTWKGYREIALNPQRNAADFRSIGGPKESLDKSVHQFEVLELPYDKLLVFYGQHRPCRRAVILDIRWLYETRRREDFLNGLVNISSQSYVKSVLGGFKGTPTSPHGYVGHCAYNRINGAMLVPDPTGNGKEVLHICGMNDPRLVSRVGGAVWNFPIAKIGVVTMKLRVEAGACIRLSLLDQWVNPSDETIQEVANCSTVIDANMMADAESFAEIQMCFNCEKSVMAMQINGVRVSENLLQGQYPNGLCYLHVQSVEGCPDYRGCLISSLDFCAVEETSCNRSEFDCK